MLKWGSKGKGSGQFGDTPHWSGPESIAVDRQGSVYVTDPADYRVEKFDANGNYLSQWGSKGTGDGQFLLVIGLAVDQQGHVYITDNQANAGGPTNQVSKFDGSGKFLMKWGETGMDLGKFNFIWGIAIDNQGNLYIASMDYVQKFKPK